MTKGEQSKNHLIECAARLFWKNGYNATGINDILSAAQLPKGSFYFHFKSKRELAAASVTYYENKIIDWMQETAQEKTWEEFVEDFSAYMIKEAEQQRHLGCPFAAIGQEIAFSEPEIAECYRKSLDKLRENFQHVLLSSDISEEAATSLSHRILAAYEGYLMLFRIGKDCSVLGRMKTDLIGMVKDYEAAGH